MSSALDSVRDAIAVAVAAAPVPSGESAYLHHTEHGRPSGVSAHRRFWLRWTRGTVATEYGAGATGSRHEGELHVVLRVSGCGTAALADRVADAQRALIDAINHDVSVTGTTVIPLGWDIPAGYGPEDVELVIPLVVETLEAAT